MSMLGLPVYAHAEITIVRIAKSKLKTPLKNLTAYRNTVNVPRNMQKPRLKSSGLDEKLD